MTLLTPALASRFGLGAGLGAACVLALAARPAEGPTEDGLPGAQDQDPPAGLVAAFEKGGVLFDAAASACAIHAAVEVRDELLEYLLVLPHGAAHESVFVTEADVEILNTALLTLGAEPGVNADWKPKEPPPTAEELRAGASPYEVQPPTGDGFYLYAGWREGDETFFYRIEDLVRDLESRRTLERHRFVYLGSRMVTRSSGEEVFAASTEGNLVNVSYFAQGNTLLTTVPPQCVNQTTWLPNAWLLPPRGAEVLFVFARGRMDSPPAGLRAALPQHAPVAAVDTVDPGGGESR